jgi:DNA-binding NtrC family response regulator
MTNENGEKSGLDVEIIDIVVVDENADMRALLGVYLDGRRWSVRMAATVRDALDLVRGRVPDVVISGLDFAEPPNGWDLVEALRNHDHTKHVACVAISGGGTMERGAFDAILRKPIDLAALLEVVRRLTRHVSSARRWSSTTELQ